MKYFLFICLTPLFISFAQVDSIFISDIKDFGNVSAGFYTAPLRYNSDDWIKLSSVVGVVALSSIADREIKSFSQRNQSSLSNDIFNADKYYSTEFAIGSVIALYGYGLIDNNNPVRRLAVKLTEASFLAGSITLVTKVVAGRGRPYKQNSNYCTNPFTFDNDYNSFPSGHTTLAFAYSTVMANEVDNVFWKVGWYSLAGLVGYSRIYHNQHWFSDVLMGAAIGYFSGEFVINHSDQKKETNVSIFPYPGGLAFQISF
jgi:membrane-associated phospholipid phosphatase